MSLGPISQHDWLNRNSLRAFPVAESASLRLNTGADLPNDILVDLFLVVALAGPSLISVSSLSFTARTVTVVFADTTGRSVGYAMAVLGTDPPNSSIQIRSSDGLCSGAVTFGRILDEALHPDYMDYLGVHPQIEAPIDRRCYIFTGKPILESLGVEYQDGVSREGPILSLGLEMQAEITELLINGVRETQVELSLVNPESFLPDCYPTYVDPLCFCGQNPIVTVNGVSRDEDGDLGIDIVFGPNVPGEIVNSEEQNLLEMTVEVPGNEICIEDPAIPDVYGRLGPAYWRDCPPTTPYGRPPGPDCQNRPPEIPAEPSESSSESSSESLMPPT
jgi:hypothetical protein